MMNDMITKLEIENLGWEYRTISANGGTMGFLKNDIYIIKFNGDNFIYKNNNDERLTEITIQKIDVKTLKFIDLYKFHPKDINELSEKLKEFNL